MDFKVSKKETRYQPDGPVEVLTDNVCDLYPIFANDPLFADQVLYNEAERQNVIMDIEILDDDQAELLDRAMFAVVKQRGNDPTEPGDGVQWAEAVLGEVPPAVVLQQVQSAVAEEGAGVRVTPSTVKNGSKERLIFKVELIM